MTNAAWVEPWGHLHVGHDFAFASRIFPLYVDPGFDGIVNGVSEHPLLPGQGRPVRVVDAHGAFR